MSNHTSQIDREIRKTLDSIDDARTLIDEQMDGPCTMRDALKAIEEHIGSVETEAAILGDLAGELMESVVRMRKQRDEATRQRNYLVRNRGIWDDSAAWRRVIHSLEQSGHPDLAEKLKKLIKP